MSLTFTLIRRLQGSIKYLKQQNSTEKQQREEAERELCVVLQEKELLENQTKESETLYQARYATIQTELQMAEKNYGKLCKHCKAHLAPTKLESELEDEDLDEIKNPDWLKLRSGSSLYGNKESLNKYIGNKEVVQDENQQPLLSEIHSHYYKLVQAYEHILEKTERKEGIQPSDSSSKCLEGDDKSGNVDTAGNVPHSFLGHGCLEDSCKHEGSSCKHLALPDVSCVDNRFERSPPAYKQLFKEIFHTLRRQYQEPVHERLQQENPH